MGAGAMGRPAALASAPSSKSANFRSSNELGGYLGVTNTGTPPSVGAITRLFCPFPTSIRLSM